MQVGDLVKHNPSNTLGLIVEQTALHRALVKWNDDIGEVEDISFYAGELELVSESR
jgi:hypothetical protein|tara:strand:+ start:34161 stop:34328 length:168 start_codon:yes stop_codon:yes gene_type:complete